MDKVLPDICTWFGIKRETASFFFVSVFSDTFVNVADLWYYALSAILFFRIVE